MDQDPCGDLAVAPCEVKLRWEAGAHGLPALEHPVKGGKGASAVRAFSFWSIFMDLENFNSPKVIFYLLK